MNRRGFTLVEIVIVIVVMGIAALGLTAGVQYVMYGTHKPEIISQATALAVNEAERVMGLSFAGVADEHRADPQAYTGDFVTYSWEVRVDSIDTAQANLGSDAAMANYKFVEVRVHHDIIDHISVEFLRTNY